MALLMEQTRDATTDVVAAVHDAYRVLGERVQESPLANLVSGAVAADLSAITAVIAADTRQIEIIDGGDVELDRLPAAIWSLSGRSWDVTVVVPCGRMGEAHTSLRAAPCRLQPWWSDPQGVWFGAFETP